MEDLGEKLVKAAKKGNVKLVKELIDKGANMDVKDKDGQPVLKIAAYEGHKEIAKMLIENGANLNAQDEYGWTALRLAARNGHKEIAKMLIEKGANMDVQDEYGWTALISAARNGHKEIAKMLIENGANMDVQNNVGWTALISAARNGHKEIAKMLIEKGANMDAQDEYGWTALMCATRWGHKEIAKMLIENGAKLDVQDRYGVTALKLAARYGHKEIAKMLIEKGANMDVQDKDDWTALMYATRWGHKEIVKMLIEKGTDMDVQEEDDWTALMLAASYGRKDIVKMLIENGANIYLKNKDGKTALDIAKMSPFQITTVQMIKNVDKGGTLCNVVKKGDLSKVLALLEHIDINIQNSDGMTALMVAAKYGHSKIVKILLEKDADTSICDKDGMNALMYAVYNEDYWVKDLILEKTKNKFGDKIPKDINQVDSDGMTPLMQAIKDRNNELASYLIMKGADLEAKDNKGNSVLQYLLKNGNVGLIRLSLIYGYPKMRNEEDILRLLLLRKNNKQYFSRFMSNIDLKADSNVEVVKEFIKNSDYINEKVIKILLDNGLDQKVLEKNFAIWLGKDVNSDKLYGMMSELMKKDRDIVAKIVSKNVDRVEVLKDKQEGYKIVIRKDGRAYKRYTCKETPNGYVLEEKIKNNNRLWVVNKIRKVKKIAKKVYRRTVMRKMTYEDVKSRNKVTPAKEKTKGMDKGEAREM